MAEIERLSPAAAGELVLAGVEHGPVETVIRREGRDMDPPGLVTVELVERAAVQEGGCSRRRWTLAFIAGPGDHATRTSGPAAGLEVALSSGTCPEHGFVSIGPDIGSVAALDVLRYLDEIRSPRGRANFSCSDTTSSHLCSSPQEIRRELARLSPWHIMHEGDVTIMWLGVPGQIVTEVRYRTASPNRVTVNRKIPAPF